MDAFLSDKSPDAYAKQVERLLGSPHYGERMAVPWLDVVRFADTVGYHGDQNVRVFPYRDYVIKAFNENKRFDQFTIEQLAGDLLPNATDEQRIATGFLRLNLMTREGGAQPKEYLAKSMGDRVRAVGAAWLGLTTGCAECHDHKFDPFTTRDFYSLGALFADVRQWGVYADYGYTPNKDAPGMNNDWPFPPEIYAKNAAMEKRLASLQASAVGMLAPLQKDEAAIRQWRDQAVSYLAANPTGWSVLAPAGVTAAKATVHGISPDNSVVFSGPPQKDEIITLDFPLPNISIRAIRFEVLPADKILKTHILPRGAWMNPAEEVQPAFPGFLPHTAARSGGGRLNRLDLAQWLIAKENPLTARQFSNRLWKQFFGKGLSNVLDDLGNQGEWPSHPQLLDWLASEFRDSGWDVKHMVRLIVTSRTYRQVSASRADLLEKDPANRLLAEQSARRLDAEFVRDNALSISGLLNDGIIGGPSAKPYQPAGYWANLNFPARDYYPSTDTNQYRRGLYMHWQRTFMHPMLAGFDAPSREECTADRFQSNSPQQALTLLNDPSFVEAARGFALRIIREQSGSDEDRIRYALKLALSSEPKPGDVESLVKFLTTQRDFYKIKPEDAAAFLKTGLSDPGTGKDPAELAAWSQLCRVILNLTKPSHATEP